jgi:hypothetical protein
MVYPKSTARSLRIFAWSVLTVGVASAQYPPVGYPGGYPPGGYPGQYPYPGQRGPSIPIPTRGSKQPKDNTKTDAGQVLPNFRGKLKQMDDKTISLEMGDNRVLDFKRTSKTKFYKNGDEIKTPKFSPGDQISIEGPEDQSGYFTAVNVYWEKAASSETSADKDKDKKDGVVDTWATDAPGSANKTAPKDAAATDTTASKEASAERVPPPSRSDPADPGPPKLRRGGVADPSREHASDAPPEPSPTLVGRADSPGGATVRPPAPDGPSIRRIGDEDAAPITTRPMDEMIRKATDAALDFTETLPAYVCQEVMSRFQSETRPANWHALDVVTTNLVYENGKEDYRDVAINGKKINKSIEETGGAWSTGEFGTVLVDLFSPATATDFVYQRESRIAGISAKLYDFRVNRENSHWTIHMGSQSYNPPYKGSVWIDPQTARVLRIEMEAFGFPGSFPIDHVESATDYQYIRLGDAKQYLLPVHAETLSCERGTDMCSRNTIDFRNYHKYTGESSITFGAPKE